MISAINSEFVGFPLPPLTVYPKRLFNVSSSPRPHAPRWHDGWRAPRGSVSSYESSRSFGYRIFVTEDNISGSRTDMIIASLRYWYPLIWAGNSDLMQHLGHIRLKILFHIGLFYQDTAEPSSHPYVPHPPLLSDRDRLCGSYPE